ncbi:uncharacterized protein EV420DRAFT_1573524 [Desarmillaria tabescens]|uniref:Uncharacterized protein n=1 Tax=Armillaria tabescens TaxID=1929756 RepID=A0AA39JMF2_ARMTA|nr:uncharacterized protein EV420DRAFT_1573524 [Desarmillaria tabescens]KAK0444942.1 hypothetical protein EV420DRAFT_1573524 [Desarmillaria tabescens]
MSTTTTTTASLGDRLRIAVTQALTALKYKPQDSSIDSYVATLRAELVKDNPADNPWRNRAESLEKRLRELEVELETEKTRNLDVKEKEPEKEKKKSNRKKAIRGILEDTSVLFSTFGVYERARDSGDAGLLLSTAIRAVESCASFLERPREEIRKGQVEMVGRLVGYVMENVLTEEIVSLVVDRIVKPALGMLGGSEYLEDMFGRSAGIADVRPEVVVLVKEVAGHLEAKSGAREALALESIRLLNKVRTLNESAVARLASKDAVWYYSAVLAYLFSSSPSSADPFLGDKVLQEMIKLLHYKETGVEQEMVLGVMEKYWLYQKDN